MDKLILPLSATESIRIEADDHIDLQDLEYCCSNLTAYFVHQNKELKIGQQTAGDFFEPLIKKLNQAINNQLPLHESLTQNLGLMQNQYYHNRSGFFMIKAQQYSQPYWVGFNYDVWSTYSNTRPIITTWLYNETNTNIVLELAQDYPWHFAQLEDNDQQDPDFITYEQFMENYQVVLHRIIPKETAQAWLDQIIPVYRSLFKNEQDFLREYEELLNEMPS